LVGLGGRQTRAPVLQETRDIVGMDVGAPAEPRPIPVARRTLRDAEELAPSAVDEIDGNVRPRSPEQLKDAIDDEVKLLRTSPTRLLPPPGTPCEMRVPQGDGRLRCQQLHDLDPSRGERVRRRPLEVERAEQLALRRQG